MINKIKINKIAERILDYPLKSEENISFFVPIICKEFSENETIINDLLTDTQTDNCIYLQNRLENIKGKLNTGEDRTIDFYIIPSERSIFSANNNAPEFQRKCIEYLDSLNEGDKGRQFEKIVQYLLKQIGIITKTTDSTGDNGIDLIGSGNAIKPLDVFPTYFIQCKYYSNKPDVNLPKKVAADVVYNLFEENTEVTHPIIPMIVCNHQQTDSIQKFCEKHGIYYLSFESLIHICSETFTLNFEKMFKDLK